MTNRILITGGLGFIGSNTASYLLKKGYNILIVDNLSSGNYENIEEIKRKVEVIEGDIRDYNLMLKVLENCYGIIHNAAMVSVVECEKKPHICFDVNIGGTLNVIKAAIERRVKKILFASSCAVYGDNSDFPLKEENYLKPLSFYAFSKMVGEQILSEVAKKRKIDIVIFRYFNIYGPKQNLFSKYSAVVSRFFIDAIKKGKIFIEGDGSQTRDFTFVMDVARANYLALRKDLKGVNIFNICSQREISILDLAKIYKKYFGNLEIVYAKERKNDIKRSLGCFEKARKFLNYMPKYSLEKGLKETLEYYMRLLKDGRENE